MKRFLKEGDIISIDVGCHYQGFVGDLAYTYPVGAIAPAVQRLLDVTEKALYVGIAASVLPNETKDVSIAIQNFVERQGYSVVREWGGFEAARPQVAALSARVAACLRGHLGLNPEIAVVAPKTIPRSEGKAVRVVERR
jgi:methionine aminopeptidase